MIYRCQSYCTVRLHTYIPVHVKVHTSGFSIHRDPLVASFKEIRTQPGEMGEPVPQHEILHVTMVTVKMFQPSTVRHKNTHITYHIWKFNVAPEDRPTIHFQVLC